MRLSAHCAAALRLKGPYSTKVHTEGAAVSVDQNECGLCSVDLLGAGPALEDPTCHPESCDILLVGALPSQESRGALLLLRPQSGCAATGSNSHTSQPGRNVNHTLLQLGFALASHT